MLRRISAPLLASIFAFALSPLLFISASNAETAAYRTQRVSFHVDSRPDGFTRVYYSCSSVEAQVETLLQQLGARNVMVRCTGGIDPVLPEVAWESDVDVRFDALTLVGPGAPGAMQASFRDIRIHEWDSCYLLRQTFDEVAPGFVLRNIMFPNSCSSSRSAFRLELTTLFP